MEWPRGRGKGVLRTAHARNPFQMSSPPPHTHTVVFPMFVMFAIVSQHDVNTGAIEPIIQK